MKDNRLFCLLNAVFSAMQFVTLWGENKHGLSIAWFVLFVAWAVMMFLEYWKR